jgi:hypothetical protein
MTAIKIDVARLSETSVILRPTDLLLENADGLRDEMDFTNRMARIIRLWDAAKQIDSPLANLIRNWSEAIRATDPDYKTIEKCAQEISDLLQTQEDPLPLVETQLEIVRPGGEESSGDRPRPATPEGDFGLDDDISPDEALIRRIKVWRQQAERGSTGRKFSRDVSAAYDFRCLFTGQRLPRLEVTESPGVDSAHILPWSTHDLNSVSNGICLSKQCHWAFDEGILRLEFDKSANTYKVDLPNRVRRVASEASFDLGFFESVTGPIPDARLPRNQANWPSPRYLEDLNRWMDNG